MAGSNTAVVESLLQLEMPSQRNEAGVMRSKPIQLGVGKVAGLAFRVPGVVSAGIMPMCCACQQGQAHTCILQDFIGCCSCPCLVCVQVLVLEHLSGGEMLRQLQRLKRYSEANACQMFKQVCMHGGQGVATAAAALTSTRRTCSCRA